MPAQTTWATQSPGSAYAPTRQSTAAAGEPGPRPTPAPASAQAAWQRSRQPAAVVAAPAAAPPSKEPEVPLGMQSVAAASSPQLLDRPTNPHVGPTPGVPAVQIAEDEGNAFTVRKEAPPATPPSPDMVNAFNESGTPPSAGESVVMQAAARGAGMPAGQPYPPMRLPQPPMPPLPAMPPAPPMPPMPMDRGTPSGMANAFTTAGTARPIPADFGPQQYPNNAFTDEGTDLMTNHGQAFLPANGRPPINPVMAVPGPMPAGPAPMAAASPEASFAARPAGPHQLLAQLHNSLYPSEREWAAERLSREDWHGQPQVVQGLLDGARTDPAPMVRAECVRALARMKVNMPPVVSALQALGADADPQVRLEVQEALAVLQAPVPRAEGGVQQASFPQR
jgi:hypothetical protein